MTLNINWQAKRFNELTTDELYEALKLRVDVFVVEQTCYYPDLDEKDRDSQTIHLLGYDGDVLVAYVRLLAVNVSYPNCVSIGRVATAQAYRGKGIGHPLMQKALELCAETWPNIDVKIGAQEHLEKYYNQHDFIRVSDMYLEDDIPHIDMLRSNEH